ncbi:MAG: tagaturonate reductase, partial [Planctomycetota bacterium]
MRCRSFCESRRRVRSVSQMSERETVLQFGAGNFLRAFADHFIHLANQGPNPIGKIVVVQSTPGERAQWLNDAGGRYHVVFRGIEDGERVDRVEVVESVRRAIVASDDWESVLALAESPDLRFVLSNTTEAGYDLDESDGPSSSTPRSFPAKLLQVLHRRFEARAEGLTIIPCELRDDNAELLRATLADLASSWSLGEGFSAWLNSECKWWGTLVDRIVTGRPDEHELLESDPLLTVGEPFALWAIQNGGEPFIDDPAIKLVEDVGPYALRKVRILNGAHTALVSRAKSGPLKTVREAVLDPEVGAWLKKLLFEEVLPTIDDRIEDGERFCHQALERFANPFVEHRLESIALHHDSKVRVRLLPTRDEFRAQFGREPELLNKILANEGGVAATATAISLELL